jgi:succinoglycan biosynthesis protein ExoM
MQQIAILVCTRKKNPNLIKCLNSLKYLSLKHKIKLVLIENNFHRTLNSLDFKKLNLGNNMKVFYKLEKKIGIPFARNKSLEILKKIKCNFVCFFDDDCEVSSNWLDSMIKIQKLSRADIVTGPQRAKSKNLFLKVLERENKHLKQLKWAATNNVYAKKESIIGSNVKFSEKLKKIGGSDQLFFLNISRKGKKIIWNNNAIVSEFRDKKRENFKWFLERNIRYGSSSFKIFKEIYGPFKGAIICMVKSLYEFLKFLFYLFIILLDIRINFLKSIQFLTRSIFTFLGIFGFRLKKYI